MEGPKKSYRAEYPDQQTLNTDMMYEGSICALNVDACSGGKRGDLQDWLLPLWTRLV